MSYPISRLIEDHRDLIYARPDTPLSEIVRLMLENDFSQIPVVDSLETNGKQINLPLGMITNEDILQAMEDFNCSITDLIADNAMQPPVIVSQDDDVFDLFDVLAAKGAVLVSGNNSGGIVSIVTSSDIVEFFKQRTVDSLYLEDIENAVKELIQYFFMDSEDQLDEQKLNDAIELIHSSDEGMKKNYRKAIGIYINEVGFENKRIHPDAIEKSYKSLDYYPERKEFSYLSFDEFIRLLTHKARWHFYQPIFKVSLESVKKRLETVRDIRNQLAHYRAEISVSQRKELRRTWQWIGRCQTEFEERRNKENDVKNGGESLSYTHDIAPIDEDIDNARSKYAPLATWLRTLPGSVDKTKLTFGEIEDILGFKLPASAYTSRSWWINDSVENNQSKEWLAADWRVGYRNMSAQHVFFVRIKERERQYIDFFAEIMNRLRNENKLPIKDSSPDGSCWIAITGIVIGSAERSLITLSFASSNRYRMELYIDTGDKSINKKVFDALIFQKESIENDLGSQLAWERIDEKRASRIALYASGSITQSGEDLKKLQEWTVKVLPRFYCAVHDRALNSLNLALSN